MEIVPSGRERLVAARTTGLAYEPGERARIVVAELVAAADHVAQALDIASGGLVIRRVRVTERDGVPSGMSTSWFRASLADRAPRLLVAERIAQGTCRYIEECTGWAVASVTEEVRAASAPAHVAAELSIEEGSSVLAGRSLFADVAGAVVEFGEFVLAPGLWRSYRQRVP